MNLWDPVAYPLQEFRQHRLSTNHKKATQAIDRMQAQAACTYSQNNPNPAHFSQLCHNMSPVV